MVTVKYNGNLGNQMFELWSLYGIGASNVQDVRVPVLDNKGNAFPYEVFKGEFLTVGPEPYETYKEKQFNFYPVELSDKNHTMLQGYFQSERYWLAIEKALRKKFEFTDKFISFVHNRVSFGIDEKTICISVRRGDFVNNIVYYQLPAMYYIGALIEHFPNFRDMKIIILSDDFDYCKAHFSCLPNVFFAEGFTAMEQLCLGHMCNHHIISNSTFSWWCAYLSKSKKVVRPQYNFGMEYGMTHSEVDFWPAKKTWEIFAHEEYKIDLKDTTFMIPVFHDHTDRRQNLDLSVCMLQRDFDTNVSVMEHGGNKFWYMEQWCTYEQVNYPAFHRTKMLNVMAKKAKTPIIFNWDADVVITPLQVYLSVLYMRKKEASFVYPYDGRFIRVLRRPYFKILSKALDIGVYQNADSFEYQGAASKEMALTSVGGAVGMLRKSFLEAGGENENMVSYAPEDCERWDRWHALGYKVLRVPGKLYHIDHFCGPDSTSRNPYFLKNHEELDRIRDMSKQQLRDYIRTWSWAQ